MDGKRVVLRASANLGKSKYQNQERVRGKKSHKFSSHASLKILSSSTCKIINSNFANTILHANLNMTHFFSYHSTTLSYSLHPLFYRSTTRG